MNITRELLHRLWLRLLLQFAYDIVNLIEDNYTQEDRDACLSEAQHIISLLGDKGESRKSRRKR